MSQPKRALFIVERNNYYKFLAPLVNELLVRGVEVFLFHRYSAPRFDDVKALSFPAFSIVPQFFNNHYQKIAYWNNEEILNFSKRKGVDLIFSLHSWHRYEFSEKEVRPAEWVTLQHWGDNFQEEKGRILGCDYLLLHSLYWWQIFLNTKFGEKCRSYPIESRHPKLIEGGVPYHDCFVGMNPSEVKEQMGLDPDRKMLLYTQLGAVCAFKNRIQYLWDRACYNTKNPKSWQVRKVMDLIPFVDEKWKIYETTIVDAIREFCDRQNAYFVVKGRWKKKVSSYIEGVADRVVYDEEYYPSTVVKLICASDLVVSHFSSMCFETGSLGRYTLNIQIEPSWDSISGEIEGIFGPNWLDHFNVKGLSEIQTGSSFIQEFPKASFDKFQVNSEACSQFRRKYFGECELGRFSEKCLDDIFEEWTSGVKNL